VESALVSGMASSSAHAEEIATEVRASPAEVKEAIQIALSSVNVPRSFCCPILQEIMTDPVQTCDGFVYERIAIGEWFERGNRRSPMTGLTLRSVQVQPVDSLRRAIQEFVEGHPKVLDDKLDKASVQTAARLLEADLKQHVTNPRLPQGSPSLAWRKLIIRACRQGHAYVLKGILHAAPEAFQTVMDDNLAMLVAVEKGNVDVLDVLLEVGLQSEFSYGIHGGTLVHLAAYQGHTEIIKSLHSYGADINALDCLGRPPLYWAVGHNCAGTVHILLELGASCDFGELLIVVAECTDVAIASKLLPYCDVRDDAREHEYLHRSVMFSCPEVVDIVLQWIPASAKASYSWQHWMSSAMLSSAPEAMISVLVKHKADFGKLVKHKASVLWHLHHYHNDKHVGNVNKVKELVSRNYAALRLPVEDSGLTAAHLAAAKGRAKAIRLLHGYGEPLNGTHAAGYTPAHYAAGFGEMAVLTVLLHCGVSLHETSDDGTTPEAYALQYHQYETAHWIANLGQQPPPPPQLSCISCDLPEDTTLTASPVALWKVVGGREGIIVRACESLQSDVLAPRLAIGAIVRQIDRIGDRLHYLKINGHGPDQGWVSTKAKGKNLVEQLDTSAVSM